MKNLADLFQQACLAHSPVNAESASPQDTFLSLSTSEQQRFQAFLEHGVPIERLVMMLENRGKKPTINPVLSVAHPQRNGGSTPSLANHPAILASPLAVQRFVSAAQVADQEEQENLDFEEIKRAFRAIPGLPRRTRRQLPTEYRPTAPRNPSPQFVPAEWHRKTPPMNQKLVKLTMEGLPVAFWERLLVLKKIKGMRIGCRKDYAQAIKAVVAYLFSTMNLSTLQCATCGRRIAEACGLTPSQVSRILDYLAEAGFITKHLTRGEDGHFQPLEIFITPALIEAFGVSRERLAQVQQDHKKYSKPANQKVIKAAKNPATTDKCGSALQQVTDKLKAAMKPVAAKFVDLKNRYARRVAELVDSALRSLGVGRYSPSFSTT